MSIRVKLSELGVVGPLAAYLQTLFEGSLGPELGLVAPDKFGADPSGVKISDAAMGEFFQFLQSNPHYTGIGRGIYRVSQDFAITRPINLNFEGAVVVQTLYPFGFIQLKAGSEGSTIKNLSGKADLTNIRPPSDSTRYYGYNQGQRHCVLWVETGENEIDRISGEGMFNTTCLRGPVIFNPDGAGYTGQATDPNTAYFWDTNAENNRVTNVFCREQDFAITGHQQTNAYIVGFGGAVITEDAGEPPHVIYMRSHGGVCYGGHIESGSCDNSPDGVAHKFHNFEGAYFGDLSAHDASGTTNFIDCHKCTWADLSGHNIKSEGAILRFAHNFSGCTGVIYGASVFGAPDSGVGLINVIDGAMPSDITLFNAFAKTDWDSPGVTDAAIRCGGASVLRVKGLHHTEAGADASPTMRTAESGLIYASGISTVGVKSLAAGSGGNIHLEIDPLQIQNWPLTNSGSVTTSITERHVEFEHGASTSLYGNTTPGAPVYSMKRCYIERTGGRVNSSIIVTLSGAFGGTGNLRFGPLPYAISSTAGRPAIDVSQIITRAGNITVAAGSFMVATLADGLNYIQLQTLAGLTRAQMTEAALGANATFEFDLEYYTNDAF